MNWEKIDRFYDLDHPQMRSVGRRWERVTEWPLMIAAVVFLAAYAIPVLNRMAVYTGSLQDRALLRTQLPAQHDLPPVLGQIAQ
jgi:hypothetical protein